MEKPMVWSHMYWSWLGVRRASFLFCLFKDKEALSVCMGSCNLTINYINRCQKVPVLQAEWRETGSSGSDSSGPIPPNPLI
jgi:hypothetical protein